MRTIWLAGGCFWGVESYFQQLKGVVDTTVGYAQGVTDNPSYEQVCTGTTGHTETCEVTYDETILPLTKILEHFFRIVDPTTRNRQGPDRGTQYRSGIYTNEESELTAIRRFTEQRQKDYQDPIVVEVEKLRVFSPAEEYHQDYLRKNPRGYCHIDMGVISPDERG